jgi:biopolymer transport protein ExbD
MAEVDTGGGKGGKGKSKKVSTKIDMTPMVDLGFLLITFFMLATTFSKPKTMEINMPDKPKDKDEKPPELKESNAFTVLVGDKDKIYYYSGIKEPEVNVTNFDADKGIRKELLKKKSNPDIVIIIKFSEKAKYRNIVDILDEMAITGMKRYAIVDFTKDDQALIDKEDEKAGKQ